MTRLDRHGGILPGGGFGIIVGLAAVVGVVVVIFGGALFSPAGRTVRVDFYDSSGDGPAVGVRADVLRDGRIIASGVSGSDGSVTFRGLPADTMSLVYGGGKWVWHGEGSAFSTIDQDISLTRGVLPCPHTSCGPTGP